MKDILQPMVVLLAWTMVMWAWMYITRLPAMQKADIDTPNLVGSTGGDLDRVLAPKTQWKAHNYNHLMAEPTLFYAVCIVLFLVGHGQGMNMYIAWAYVGLRIAHSVFQSLINRVVIRFAIFVLSSLCLIALIVHAMIAIF
jgi:hypothetical protein